MEMTFAINSLDYFGKWLLSFTGKVEIISPDNLKITMVKFANEIKTKYLRKSK